MQLVRILNPTQKYRSQVFGIKWQMLHPDPPPITYVKHWEGYIVDPAQCAGWWRHTGLKVSAQWLRASFTTVVSEPGPGNTKNDAAFGSKFMYVKRVVHTWLNHEICWASVVVPGRVGAFTGRHAARRGAALFPPSTTNRCFFPYGRSFWMRRKV